MSNVRKSDDFGYVSSIFADAILSARGGVFGKEGQTLARSAPDLMEADLFGLYLLDDAMSPSGTLLSRPMDGFLWEYENFRSQDPIFLHLLRQQQATDGVSLLGQETWSRHPLTQFLGGWGLHYSLQGGVFVNGRVVATINFARSKRGGPFVRQQRLELDALCQQISTRLAGRHQKCRPRPAVDIAVDVRAATGRRAELILLTDGAGLPVDRQLPPEGPQLGIVAREMQKAIAANVKMLEASQQGNIAESEIAVGDGPLYALTTFAVPGSGNFVSCLVLAGQQPCPQYDPLSHFGARTRHALELLVRGYSNKLIAREMRISENTVKDHVRRIYQHFGARTRTELAWVLHGRI